MIWGCMSAQGVGELCFIDGTVNASRYQDILDHQLLPSIQRLQRSDGSFIFQQDGASCHTAKQNMKWLREHNIPVLTWPANSPDLSPIESLWGKMKKELRTNPAKNLDELKEKIQEVWDGITPEYCFNLVETLPSRITAVIKKKVTSLSGKGQLFVLGQLFCVDKRVVQLFCVICFEIIPFFYLLYEFLLF